MTKSYSVCNLKISFYDGNFWITDEWLSSENGQRKRTNKLIVTFRLFACDYDWKTQVTSDHRNPRNQAGSCSGMLFLLAEGNSIKERRQNKLVFVLQHTFLEIIYGYRKCICLESFGWSIRINYCLRTESLFMCRFRIRINRRMVWPIKHFSHIMLSSVQQENNQQTVPGFWVTAGHKKLLFQVNG